MILDVKENLIKVEIFVYMCHSESLGKIEYCSSPNNFELFIINDTDLPVWVMFVFAAWLWADVRLLGWKL